MGTYFPYDRFVELSANGVGFLAAFNALHFQPPVNEIRSNDRVCSKFFYFFFILCVLN